VLVYPAGRTKYVAPGATIPPKLKRPDKSADAICKIGIRFLADKTNYVVDNVAVIRENLFRETLFSWEHLPVPPFCVLPRTQKGYSRCSLI
jgi:hypothetical protein